MSDPEPDGCSPLPPSAQYVLHVLDREQDPDDGRRLVWLDDGLHRLGEHGDVDLVSVDFDDLDEDEVRQVARSSIYTWEFTNFADFPPDPPSARRSTGGATDSGVSHPVSITTKFFTSPICQTRLDQQPPNHSQSVHEQPRGSTRKTHRTLHESC